jgi:deoxyribodipyrimidine photolyase-related protein
VLFVIAMSSISLVFPNQLFAAYPALHAGQEVVLVEEFLFFKQYNFHKQKIVLHRATMKAYADTLQKQGYSVTYIDSISELGDIRQLLPKLAAKGVTKISYCKTVDDWLESRLQSTAAQCGIELKVYENPNFICTEDYLNTYFATKKRYYLTAFYTDQRQRLGIMLDEGKPLGGKWTFDTENRLKMPAKTPVPALPKQVESPFIKEAIAYAEQNFANNLGLAAPFNYPITPTQSVVWLKVFLKERFANYGIYQDAIVPGQTYLFHSVITPMLNIGLLSPAQVIDEAIAAADEYGIPLNSLEGFVRQVLGWREYLRAVYQREGKKQRTRNYWNHGRPIPKAFYDGTTGIAPVDDCIKKLHQTAYNHHIERLMVLGNFMCLCGFSPNAIYQWFMEFYIDAYDWVMVPNVYGMSQFADGGLMSTKPYISSSNYIMKMSNYKPAGNEDWMLIWDALYWRFIHENRAFFQKNPRMSVMTMQLDKMGPKLQNHLRIADEYLASL